jgi:hypothetical protein
MASPPDWLSMFVNAVAANIHSHDVLSPLGCHFQLVKNVWEITVFASRTEIVGGSEDGRSCHSSFDVDIKAVADLMTHVDGISWQTQPLDKFDELGAHLAVEGQYEDKQIWLRITSTSPERFDPGRRAMVNQQQFEEIW